MNVRDRKLSKKQRAVLDAIIALWHQNPDPVRQGKVAARLQIPLRNVDHAVSILRRKGFVEYIVYEGRRFGEIKPLRHPDGRDFFDDWSPPESFVPATDDVMRIPPAPDIEKALKKQALAGAAR